MPERHSSSLPPSPPPAPRNGDWRTLHLWQIQGVRDILAVAAICGVLWLGYRLSVVTVPILLALLLAYLFEPLVRWATRRRHFSRPGVAIAIIVGAFFVVFVPVMVGIGTAGVQGIRVARGMAQTSGNFLTVMRYSQQAAEQGPAFGAILLKEDPSEPGDLRPEFVPGEPADDGKRAEAARAQTAYAHLPGALKRVAIGVVERHQAPPPPPPLPSPPEPGAAPGPEGEPSPASPTPSGPTGGPVLAQPAAAPEGYILLDRAIAWVQDNTAAIGATLGKQALGTGAGAVGAALRTVKSIGSLGLMLFLTAFFFYFFSTGYGRVLSFWEGLIPERRKSRVIDLAGRMDVVIAGFVRGRLTIASLIVLLYTIGYWAIGVPAPLLVGPIVGALAIVPFVSTLAMPLAMLLMLVDPSQLAPWQHAWWWIIAGPVIIYILERILDDYILTPMIQGKTTDMDTPTILFASLAGGVLAGVYGLLIAIPVAACLKILMKEVFWPRVKAWGEGKERDFLPISR